MSRIWVAGAGAFGTALAIAYARDGKEVSLWGRNVAGLALNRTSPYLPGVSMPESLEITEDFAAQPEDTLLVALPMQAMDSWLKTANPKPQHIVACCKGLDLSTLQGPSGVIESTLARPGHVLTGPSFAQDIAAGLPTALTLAVADQVAGELLQKRLSTASLRLYLTSDVTGAELGGALKNVMALACGAAIGSGFGESARAALLARGLSEMSRFAVARGGQAATLQGLSGLGDLALTATSEKSRNYRAGLALGRGEDLPNVTTEGLATTRAVVKEAQILGIEMPIAQAVLAVIDRDQTVAETLKALLARPLKLE